MSKRPEKARRVSPAKIESTIMEQRRAASPSACARAYGIPNWRVRKAIREGELTAFGVGRKSLLLFSDLEQWIKSHPPTKSSRPNKFKPQEASHAAP
jgi:excisionase family DNA binding protein